MSALSRTYEKACEAARAKGLRVDIPGPRMLYVDIDDKVSLARFKAAYDILEEQGWVCGCTKTRSPSGKPYRWHIRVEVTQPISDERRVLLQAVLGSDPKREALSFIRVVGGEKYPTLFFEKP